MHCGDPCILTFQATIYRSFTFLVDCEWGPWGPCSKTCGTGTQTRDVTQFAKNGGAPCIGPTVNYCNLQACPPDIRGKI